MIIHKQSTNHTSIKNRLRCYATSVLMINLLNLAMLLFFQKAMAVIVYWTACVWTERVLHCIWGGGSGILLQVHFNKMKHYSLLFPFFSPPLPPASLLSGLSQSMIWRVWMLPCIDLWCTRWYTVMRAATVLSSPEWSSHTSVTSWIRLLLAALASSNKVSSKIVFISF